MHLTEPAEPEIKKALKSKHGGYGSDAERYKRDISVLLPWHDLWAGVLLKKIIPIDLSAAIDQARDRANQAEARSYEEYSATGDEIAHIWSQILVAVAAPEAEWLKFDAWRKKLKHTLFTPTAHRNCEARGIFRSTWLCSGHRGRGPQARRGRAGRSR